MARLQLQSLRRLTFLTKSSTASPKLCQNSTSPQFLTLSSSWNQNSHSSTLAQRFNKPTIKQLGHKSPVYSKLFILASIGGNLNLKALATEVRLMSTEDSSTRQEQGRNDESSESTHDPSHGGEHHHSTKIDGGKKYSAVQINCDGSWHTIYRNASELVHIHHVETSVRVDKKPQPVRQINKLSFEWPRSLIKLFWVSNHGGSQGIHARDVDLLANENPFISQRAIVAVRNEKIMVRMENVRALLGKDHVLLFEARRPRSFKERGFVGAAPSVSKSGEQAEIKARELFAVYMSQQAREPFGHPLDAMPFHLRMMECLLDDTSTFFYQRAERLKVVVERMLEELTGDVNMGGLQRLLPLKRALTEIEHDVRDTHHALEQVLNSDELLQAICLDKTELSWPTSNSKCDEGDPQHPTLRQAAADMILTYQRQVDNAGGALEELRKDMDATQEIWELGLDTTRNRIIQMDLLFSMGTLSLAVAALVTGYFGMNLPSGFEEDPRVFWWVVTGTTATTFTICCTLVLLFRIWPRIIDKRRARDLAGLRDLLGHLDDIDDIFQAVAREVAGRAVTRAEFKQILHSHPTAKFMRQRELDLMFRMFDTNRDGLLENCDLLGGCLGFCYANFYSRAYWFRKSYQRGKQLLVANKQINCYDWYQIQTINAYPWID